MYVMYKVVGKVIVCTMFTVCTQLGREVNIVNIVPKL